MCLALSLNLSAQDIDFSQFGNYTVTIEPEPGYETLQFGDVIQGQGETTVNLGDSPGMAVLGITGVPYLDVIVSITKPSALIGVNAGNSDEIPITMLNAAYANNGTNDYVQANVINGLQARFPILARQSTPPGPPPTPPRDGVGPPTETAYIYLWGSIDVGEVQAGVYTATINVSVEYN